MAYPPELETITLLKFARSYTYIPSHKSCKWKERTIQAIVNVYPKFHSIPNEESKHFETFCWSELLLYKHFRNIMTDIGVTKDTIITNWHQMHVNKYDVFHIIRHIKENASPQEEVNNKDEMNITITSEMNEWELFSRMRHTVNNNLDKLELLGQCEFDTSYNWAETKIPHELHDIASQFINIKKTTTQDEHVPTRKYTPTNTLSAKQKKALSVVSNHNTSVFKKPLHMIIQGTAGIGKSYLIIFIKNMLHKNSPQQKNPILVLAPTRIAAFNIHATTIHSTL